MLAGPSEVITTQSESNGENRETFRSERKSWQLGILGILIAI